MNKTTGSAIALVLLVATAFAAFATLAGCEKKTVGGLDIELAEEAFGAVSGLSVSFRLIDWDSKEVELNSGRIDLVWNGLTITDERKANMEISEPYMTNEQAIVARAEDKEKYANPENLKGKKIAVEKGSAGEEAMNKYCERAKGAGIELRPVDSQIAALVEVKANQSDAAVIDLTMGRYITKTDTSFKDLTVVEAEIEEFEEEEYGVAAKKGKAALIGFVNRRLREMQESGKFASIMKKYGVESRTKEIKGASEASAEAMIQELNAGKRAADKNKIVIGYTINPPMAIEAKA